MGGLIHSGRLLKIGVECLGHLLEDLLCLPDFD